MISIVDDYRCVFGYGRDDLMEIDGVVVEEQIQMSIRKIKVYGLSVFIHIFNLFDASLTDLRIARSNRVTANIKM